VTTPEERLAYNREWHRNYQRLIREKRERMAQGWGSLHDIGCPYPAKGCRCKAIILIKPENVVRMRP
jgi:hypothetical protein